MKLRETLIESCRLLHRAGPFAKGLGRLDRAVYELTARRLDTPKFVTTRLSRRNFLARLDLRDRIQFRMYVTRFHEPATEKVLIDAFDSYCPEDSVFIDVGANIGYFSLLAASLGMGRKILAFEAFPGNAERVSANAALNGFKNIEVIGAAVSDREGMQDLYIPDPIHESGWNSASPEAARQHGGLSIQVKMLRLDNELARRKSPPPGLLKIDVEGHELSVLRGGEATFKAQGPRMIIIEINESCLKAQGASGSEIAALLQSWGYQGTPISREGNWIYDKKD